MKLEAKELLKMPLKAYFKQWLNSHYRINLEDVVSEILNQTEYSTMFADISQPLTHEGLIDLKFKLSDNHVTVSIRTAFNEDVLIASCVRDVKTVCDALNNFKD